MLLQAQNTLQKEKKQQQAGLSSNTTSFNWASVKVRCITSHSSSLLPSSFRGTDCLQQNPETEYNYAVRKSEI